MGPIYRPVRLADVAKGTKRTVKYLAVCHNPRLQREILRAAPDGVYKSICNAFYNVAENPEIALSKKHKQVFTKHHRLVQQIISPQVKLKRKRKIIQRGGGIFLAAILPAVISTALSFLGSTFIKPQ